MHTIKIFGERNTGTNYLQQLIISNLEAKVLGGGVPEKRGWMKSPLLFDHLFDLRYRHYLGWKHAFPNHHRIAAKPDLNNTLFITLTKNPYNFLVSLHKRPYHYQGTHETDFLRFINREWKMLKRENAPVAKYPSPVHLWNEKNRAYLALKEAFPENTMNITYEQLVDDPFQIINRISIRYAFPRLKTPFQHITASTKNDPKSYQDYKSYHANAAWKEEIPPEAYPIINQALNQEVVERFGYRIIL